MSYWVTRSTTEDRDYIVMKHSIPGVNHTINGVKFRNSYAVVDKNSKTYTDLKKLLVLKNAKELPLMILRNLPFITRPMDVMIIYGKDVYYKYLKQLEGVQAEEAIQHKEEKVILHFEQGGCKFKLANGEVCKEAAMEYSPACYCQKHILDDPKVAELGIQKPRIMTKDQKRVYRERVIDLLKKGLKIEK
jgi:hypothetical protein